MKNRSEVSRIAETPAWADESSLDEDRPGVVVHSREGDGSFQALTGDLKTPLASQHLHLEQVDRLRIDRVGRENEAVGLVADRDEIAVILTQDEGRPFPTELVSWTIDEARKLHVALGNLLDAFDASGGTQ